MPKNAKPHRVIYPTLLRSERNEHQSNRGQSTGRRRNISEGALLSLWTAVRRWLGRWEWLELLLHRMPDRPFLADGIRAGEFL